MNLGHVGFLAEAESSEVDSIVDHVVQRSYTVEERFTIEVTLRECDSPEVVWSSYAINEVSIEKAERILGYKPKYSNKDALVRNYKWYVENLKEFQNKSGVSHRVPWGQGALSLLKKVF